jgi:hypothetical protein
MFLTGVEGAFCAELWKGISAVVKRTTAERGKNALRIFMVCFTFPVLRVYRRERLLGGENRRA